MFSNGRLFGRWGTTTRELSRLLVGNNAVNMVLYKPSYSNGASKFSSLIVNSRIDGNKVKIAQKLEVAGQWGYLGLRLRFSSSTTEKSEQKVVDPKVGRNIRRLEQKADDFIDSISNIPPDFKTIDQIAASVDTTLTPEQKEYVEMLKKKYQRAKYSKYTHVPKLEDIESEGNFSPNIPPNAQELIDWALSHIHKRDGKRRTREKKRQARRWEIKREDDARRIKEMHQAFLKKQQKYKRQRELSKAYVAQAKEGNFRAPPIRIHKFKF